MNHAVLTMDGTVQSLGEAIANLPTNFPIRQLFLTNPSGNATVYVGGDKAFTMDASGNVTATGDALSATSYGRAIAADTEKSFGPFENGAEDLNAIFVLGTDTQKLFIGWTSW